MREAVIVSAARTAVGKAPRGALRNVHTADLAATAIKAALERAPGLDPKEIDDVILGCALPEAEQGLNMARVLSGGDLTSPQWVTEQYILDLEWDESSQLALEPKTQERIMAILQTGKPLRN